MKKAKGFLASLETCLLVRMPKDKESGDTQLL